MSSRRTASRETALAGREAAEPDLVLSGDTTTELATISATLSTINTNLTGSGSNSVDFDPAIRHAINVISGTYGDTVSVEAKAKSLNKFGRTTNADSAVRTTIGAFQGSVVNETFVSTNIVDSIVSDSASDTETIVVEGHTIDGSGNLTFVSQEATLTGTTEVTLSTPLARATRAYVKAGTFGSPASDLVGNVYIYDNTDGISSGVPVTAAATKCMITAGDNQSEKCATAVSQSDYWLITSLTVAIAGSSASTVNVEFEIEARDVANGGVWRPLGAKISIRAGSNSVFHENFFPYFIIPKNHDVRAVATSNTNNTEVIADIQGVLAAVQ